MQRETDAVLERLWCLFCGQLDLEAPGVALLQDGEGADPDKNKASLPQTQERSGSRFTLKCK